MRKSIALLTGMAYAMAGRHVHDPGHAFDSMRGSKGKEPEQADEERIAMGLQRFEINGVYVWAKNEANARYNYEKGRLR